MIKLRVVFTLVGIVSTVSAPNAAFAADGIPTSIDRFSCGAGTSKYERLENGNGLGPTNLFLTVGQFGKSNGGYIGRPDPSQLKPPSASTGFRDLLLTFKDGVDGINTAKIRFTFKFSNGSTSVVTKSFSEMTVTPPDFYGFQTVTVDFTKFNGLNVAEANLIEFVPYIQGSSGISRISLGDFQVTTLQGNYTAGVLNFPEAKCPVIPQ